MTLQALLSSCPSGQALAPEARETPILFKIKRLIEKVIAAVKFPLRYIGSKDWSLPGLLLSIPKRAYCYFTKKPYSLSTNYYQKPVELKTAKMLDPFLRYAATNAAIHTLDDQRWIEGFDDDSLRFIDPSDLAIDVPGITIYDNKAFIDQTTGLKASVAESNKEIIIAFGAIDTFNHIIWTDQGGPAILKQIEANGETEELKQKKDQVIKLQKILKRKQEIIAAYNLLGGVPDVYKQASELVFQIKIRFPNRKITLTGQCFGGSLATYASLMNTLPAYCFNSLPLGAGIQNMLGDTRLSQGKDLITHISAKTDWISDNTKFSLFDTFLTYVCGIRTPANFGKRFTIQSAYEKHPSLTSSLPFFRSSNETHDYILGSMLKILMPTWKDAEGHDATRAKPIDYIQYSTAH